MNKITPSVELWTNDGDYREHVARVARVCYASEGGRMSADDMCRKLMRDQHYSMFRHASLYYVLPLSYVHEHCPWLIIALSNSPYVALRYRKVKAAKRDAKRDTLYFVSTNVQYMLDHKLTADLMAQFELTEAQFVQRAVDEHFMPALSLVRYTVCVTTQISTSRELNRTSPNNIAEQSTRYVNFFKRGKGITICLPHWYDNGKWYQRLAANIAWKVGEWAYNALCRFGLKAQDARTALPLDTATRVVYTYNVMEWRHILDLRLVGKTGVPHPNAKIIAQMIHDAILPAMRVYGGDGAKLIK